MLETLELEKNLCGHILDGPLCPSIKKRRLACMTLDEGVYTY